MGNIGQGQSTEKSLARYEVFDDAMNSLDGLYNSIDSLIEWINSGGGGDPAKAGTNTEQIKSVNALLSNMEEDLYKKYQKFEDVLDNLLVSLCMSTDSNLVRSSKAVNSVNEDKPGQDILEIENVIGMIHDFWNVYNTLENIYKYLTCDIGEIQLLEKTEVNFSDYNKSVEGIFSLNDMILEIVKLSRDKLEDIKNVFA